MEFVVTNNPSESRFEIACEDCLALLEYKISGNLMTLIHTEVPEDLGGKGLGGKLVKFALGYAQQDNMHVAAQCEFAQSYMQRHKEYSPLLRDE